MSRVPEDDITCIYFPGRTLNPPGDHRTIRTLLLDDPLVPWLQAGAL
jgi:hypothetical protein